MSSDYTLALGLGLWGQELDEFSQGSLKHTKEHGESRRLVGSHGSGILCYFHLGKSGWPQGMSYALLFAKVALLLGDERLFTPYGCTYCHFVICCLAVLWFLSFPFVFSCSLFLWFDDFFLGLCLDSILIIFCVSTKDFCFVVIMRLAYICLYVYWSILRR